MKEGDAIEHPWLSKNVERAQRKVEERNFQIRKNILEYDEVMEHQRQSFYGLRQRVLEGRDVKGLIFEYIEEAIDDAIEEMLDPEYPALCAAEFAKEELEVLDPARASSRQGHERDGRGDPADGAGRGRVMIDVTLGEYMPVEGSEVSVDFDSAGLVGWAKTRFGVELDAGELREGGARERAHVKQTLEEAAHAKIDAAELSGLSEFVVPNYGARKLSEWVERKFGFEVSADEIVEAKAAEDRNPRDPIMEKAEELYEKREIEYPVEFVMEMTMLMARRDPASAMGELAEWGRRRFGDDLDAEGIKKLSPAKVRERYIGLNKAFVAEDKLNKAIDEAVAIGDDDALDEHLKSNYGAGLSDRMRWLEDEEREDAVRARVENLLRSRASLLRACDPAREPRRAGRTISTRWTSCATRSGSGRSASRTRGSSTSVRARSCSPRCSRRCATRSPTSSSRRGSARRRRSA
jgi:preprotein translocase subunit SecA